MNIQKILVIQTAFLGDVILATPVIKAIKQTFPGAEVHTLTIPGTSMIFQYNPYVTRRLVFDKKKPFKKLTEFLKLISILRANQYEIAFSIQSSMTSALLMYFSRIPLRVGFERQKLLTIPISEKRGLHTRERYLRLISPFSRKSFNSQTQIFWSTKEEQKVTAILRQFQPSNTMLLGIAPGSVWFTKRWPQDYFVSLLKMLANENISIFLIGGPDDRQLCQKIINQAQTPTINLAGELNILESAAFISKLDLMVTNDSAPLHLANAVKTDVIAIFGPTVKEFGFYPFRENDSVLEINLDCRPCSKHGGRRCPERHFRCMREITPEMVYGEIITKLDYMAE